MDDLKVIAIAVQDPVFPGESGKKDLDPEYILGTEEALKTNQRVAAVAVSDIRRRIKKGDLCTIAEIQQFLKLSGDPKCVVLFNASGQRYRVESVEFSKGVYRVGLKPVRFTGLKAEEVSALYERLYMIYMTYKHFTAEPAKDGEPAPTDNDIFAPPPVTPAAINGSIDRLAPLLHFTDTDPLYFELDTSKRILAAIRCLADEIEMIKVEEKVMGEVQAAMDDNQRDFYIREQIKALSKEIDEEDEADTYLEKIDALKTSEENKEKFRREVRRLNRTAAASPDMALIKNYLDTVIELPWGIYTDDNEDLKEAERVLNEDHYGLEKVKERLIEALAVRKLSKEGRSPIICLVGPPGVGKTSIASSIARAMNKKFVRLSLGGIRDEAEIRGHRKTYVGAMPGRIINSVMQAGSMNPVFLMDEIDKMAADYKGDPASALLEVLDPEQNVGFRDHFIEVPFDLSKVLFITTANTLDPISRPLLDRMEVIELDGYTDVEKLEIAKRYLVKKALKQNGVSPDWVEFTDDAITEIIHEYTRESGVRALEKNINSVVRKVAKRFVEAPDSEKVRVTSENVFEFLGEAKFPFSSKLRRDETGVVTGLAWTATGGDTLEVEVAVTRGKGETLLTGNLGNVMKESAKIAISYCRAFGKEWGIPEDYFDRHDIHIHVPEGATPKDGPSAGITIVTAVCSAVTGKPVKGDVAMTGELTLRGKVLPIGGLKEKSLAALRDGIKTIFLPEENRRDYKELPGAVKDKIDFRFVGNVGSVLKNAIVW